MRNARVASGSADMVAPSSFFILGMLDFSLAISISAPPACVLDLIKFFYVAFPSLNM